MDTRQMVVDFNLATRLRGQNNQVENNPFWLSLSPESFNKENIVTSDLEGMLLPITGALEEASDSPYEVETLLESSEQSMLTDIFRLRMGADAIRRDFSATPEKYVLGISVRGKENRAKITHRNQKMKIARRA